MKTKFLKERSPLNFTHFTSDFSFATRVFVFSRYAGISANSERLNVIHPWIESLQFVVKSGISC